jgi:hypothetical protein
VKAPRVSSRVTARALRQEALDLMRHTNRVAEVQNTLRSSCQVLLTQVEANEAVQPGSLELAFPEARSADTAESFSRCVAMAICSVPEAPALRERPGPPKSVTGAPRRYLRGPVQ